jgi:hypothetical protein
VRCAALVFAVGTREQHLDLVSGVAFHLPPGQSLVWQHDHLITQRPKIAGVRVQFAGHLALAEFGIGQAPGTALESGLVESGVVKTAGKNPA